MIQKILVGARFITAIVRYGQHDRLSTTGSALPQCG
jgi:hypothetical protein